MLVPVKEMLEVSVLVLLADMLEAELASALLPQVLDIEVLLVEMLVAEMLEVLVLVVCVHSIGYQGKTCWLHAVAVIWCGNMRSNCCLISERWLSG